MRKKKKENKILVLIDFENLIISSQKNIEPIGFSIETGFNKVIREITADVGEIIGVFAFLPSDRALVWGEDLYGLGFNIVLCPRVKNKEGAKQDTTDARLMELGEWLMNNLDGLTHICIGSGDKDFTPLIRKAALKRLKNLVVAADLKSLSSELIKLTERRTDGSRKVYLFSPTE